MESVVSCDDMESSPSLVLGANDTAATAPPRAVHQGAAKIEGHERGTRVATHASRGGGTAWRAQTRKCANTDRDQSRRSVWPRHYPPVPAGSRAPSSPPQSASWRTFWLRRTLLRLQALLVPRGLRVSLSARPGRHTACLPRQSETPLSLTPFSVPVFPCLAPLQPTVALRLVGSLG